MKLPAKSYLYAQLGTAFTWSIGNRPSTRAACPKMLVGWKSCLATDLFCPGPSSRAQAWVSLSLSLSLAEDGTDLNSSTTGCSFERPSGSPQT